MTKDESHNLLQEFLDKFKTPDTLTLEKYTDNGEKRDDFTYWVEWKLDCFGGIKGGSSYKFGIYKYNKRPGADVKSDNQYAWGDKLGNTCDEAFGNVKKKILDVIEYSSGDTVEYNNIEAINLGPAFKWKIAFLYSKNRLVPVYKKEALFQAAKRLEVLPEKVTVASLQKALMDYYNKHADKFDNDICSYGSYVWTIGNADLSQSNQIIKYGAPGTGKTYSVEIEAKEFFDIWQLDAQNSTEDFKDHYEFVQFHPSYSYEDFIEGIKPVLGADGNTKLQLKDGIFKTFCRKAAQYEIWLLKNGIMKPGDQEKGKLSEILVKDVRINSCEKCPISIPENAKDDEPVQDYIPPYFFVIDEINRADLSRVFGELMYCLEYRGYGGRIKTQYSELEDGDTIFYDDNGQHYFFIPENVYIIGTMNTIDRSIESFDFALRRRFLWQRVDPSESVLQEYFDKKGKQDFYEYLVPLWKKLNNKIAGNPLLGEDYEIGHSYLMKLDKYPDCDKPSAYRDIIWQKHILPILEEYFRGMGGEAKQQIDDLKKEFFSKANSKA
jgi:5-methylcytosine-specific restriction endonuclease McrBC GTP-binding regulatory subunit McrB